MHRLSAWILRWLPSVLLLAGPVEAVGAEGEAGSKMQPGLSVISRSDSLVVRELRPGVWMHTSWRQLAPGVKVPSNGLFVLRDAEIWLIDTAWGNDLTNQLLSWIETVLDRPVAGAIITHFHDDRMGGAPALKARGIQSWAHPLTLELGADLGIPLPTPLASLQAGGSVTLGGMEIFYPGPGHTADNLMVWLPEDRILFGGCAVRPLTSSSLGNVDDAILSEWPESIRRAEERFSEVEWVIPSHGPLGGPNLLRHTIQLFDVP